MVNSIKQLHSDFIEDLEIGMGRSAKTVENYDRYLKRFYKQQRIEKVSDITQDAVRNFRQWLNQSAPVPGNIVDKGVSLATQNYYLISLRQFLKYLSKRDIEALSPDKVGLAKLAEREIDVLYPEEMDDLLTATENVPKKEKEGMAVLRDRAILEVLYSTGVRVAELVSLNRDDIRKEKKSDDENLNVKELVVRGKGKKVRVVFLSNSAQRAVKDYLVKREDIDPALFVRHSPNVNINEDLRMTPRSVQRMIKKYAALAGITKQVTPHTLRHSYATDLLANGADVRQVQQLLGHASITTTQVYTHLTDVQLKEAHEKFHRKGK